ncbi:MAG: hypothetical protein KBE09_04555 [Candidatus Pacebacteria bacterium]|nr:hypothetical protein [Candidatus Paceibacterota bacterium]
MWRILAIVALLLSPLPAWAEGAIVAPTQEPAQHDLTVVLKKLHEPDARIIVMQDGTIYRLNTAMGWRFIMSEETRVLNHCHFVSVLGPGSHESLRGARIIGALDDDYQQFAVQYDLQCVKVGGDQIKVMLGVAIAALLLL